MEVLHEPCRVTLYSCGKQLRPPVLVGLGKQSGLRLGYRPLGVKGLSSDRQFFFTKKLDVCGDGHRFLPHD
jgi:hypothetical protein